jgi:urease accessory protein
MKLTRTFVAAIAITLVNAPLALAHVDPRLAGNSFGAGFLHPITGWDHLLAAMGIGLLAARLGGAAILALPGTFVCAMLGGQLLGMSRYAFPMVEGGIAASLVLIGLLIVAMPRRRLVVLSLLSAVFGLIHGHAHGNEMAAMSAGAEFSLGLLLATCLLQAGGILIGRWVNQSNSGIRMVRWAGAALATAGLYLAFFVI